MSGFYHWTLIGLLLAVPSALADLGGSLPLDMTKRFSEADKMAPIQKMWQPRMNEDLSNKRIPIKKWHAEFNSIGRLRAPFEVREREEKTLIEPKILDFKTFERKIAPQNNRMAYVRNFDQVMQKNLVPEYEDAEVVTVQEMSTPAFNEVRDTLSMREINRFSFQRNHSETGGVDVQRTVDQEEED